MSEYPAITPTLKTGDEPLKNGNLELPFVLHDFWKWSVSDILSNATRGIFAEFIVATACKVDVSKSRDEWAVYDLITPEGIKIEVKSSAYIQSWFQKRPSVISFSIKPSRAFNVKTGLYSDNAARHVDVYVFCLLANMDQETIDPMDMSQWEFYVVSVSEINNYERSQHSITLPSLRKITSPVSYEHLAEQVRKKAA